MMALRLTRVSLGSIFLLAVVLNGFLLFSALDGARLVQQVEATAGQGLTCLDWYHTRSISAYFDVQHPQQGNALYLLNLAWPVWLALSIGIAFVFARVIDRTKRWRWLLILGMSLLVLGLIVYLPTIAKISCAIE